MKIADLKALEPGTTVLARRNKTAPWETARLLGVTTLGRKTVAVLDFGIDDVWRRPALCVKAAL